MTDQFSLRLEGFEGLLKTLQTLPDDLGHKVMKKALTANAAKVVEESKRILDSEVSASTSTGRLRDAIKTIQSKYKGSFFKVSAGVRLGRKRDDKTGAYYAAPVEYGHHLFVFGKKTGKFIKPVGFLSRGLAQKAQEIISSLSGDIKTHLEKEWKKAARGKGGKVK